MKRLHWLILLIIGLFFSSFTFTPSFAKPQAAQITPISPDERAEVEQAIYQAVNSHQEEHLVTLIYQTRVMDLVISGDSQWGRAWLVGVDATTREPAPIEPGLAVTHKVNDKWDVFLQADSSWLKAIKNSPDDLVPKDEKSMWVDMYQQAQLEMPSAPFTGYRLPWKPGETRALSQSVLHDKYDSSLTAHYAFDFYNSDPANKQWPIYAAKSGTVYSVKEDIPTCNQYHCDGQGSGNYIIIKDTTTTPTSYDLYLHLVQNSIPLAFKQIGATVQRGEIIAIADNTGASYGNHLHFMVHTNSTNWWGQSVDITFEDVPINGGRPRVKNQWYDDEPYCLHQDGFNDVCDSFMTDYISRNTTCQIPDNTPPDGALINPSADGVSITGTLSLNGWGEDNQCGLAAGQFIANYNGTWQNIGPAFTTSPFSYTWDVCDVPDGPLEVGLRLTDQAVNSTVIGVHSLSKDYTCPAPPPPACIPDKNEITLFDGSNYAGTCQTFNVGNFSDLGELTLQTSSIMVGGKVQATLFANTDYTGRGETFFANDNDLADNLIGSNTASALKVNLKSQPALPPEVLSSPDESSLSQQDGVNLYWENGGSSTEYQVRLTEPVTAAITTTWLTEPYAHLENLPIGAYTWQVRGRNPTAGSGDWSIGNTFTITENDPTPPPTIPAPYTDTMETNPENWTATGLWHWVDNNTLSHSASHSWWYQNSSGNYNEGTANSGDLTSPAFTISTNGHYYLRFYYRYTTETQGKDWDQRWVEIAIDGQPFSRAITTTQRQQLTDDPFADEISNPYLASAAIDLGNLTSGQYVRVRFHFDTLDAINNNYQGWAIDDVSISTTAPADSEDTNDTPQSATPIVSGDSIAGVIRPQGDFDYYQFTANAGDRIVADVDAQSIGSLLDPYLFLLASDGKSVLAYNDDEVYAQNRDSFISFTAPYTGTYYLKLRAWNNPSVGGNQYFYMLNFYLDDTDPVLNFANPADSAGFLNNQVTVLSATVSDTQSGIAQVDFYFHNNDWLNQNWELVGSDTDGSDGWSVPFSKPDQSGVAFYVKAIDRSRNVTGQGYWNLAIDHTPPVTALQLLDSIQTSTAFRLVWSGSDNLSGIGAYQLQWSIDSGVWTDYPETYTGYTQSTWVIGAPGHQYDFRLRGIDRAGNSESFPVNAETSAFIENDICQSPDIWEVDNSAGTASGIMMNHIQSHNFCNPETTDHLNDTDWITLTVVTGQQYLIQALPTSDNAAAAVSIYTNDGSTLILRAQAAPTVWGNPTYLVWHATKNELLYIRVQHTDGRVAGNTVSYNIFISNNFPNFLPVISRTP